MRVYLDANAVIIAIEGEDEIADLVRRVFELGGTAENGLVTSELTLSEVLVRPLRENDADRARAYLSLLADGPGMSISAISRDVLLASADLRARYGALKLADAIHLATAVELACDRFLSNDHRLPRLAETQTVRLNKTDLRRLLNDLQ